MPEGDTIFRAASTLHRALAGQRVTEFSSVFPKLTRVEEDSGVVGRCVESVEARGKWLLIHFSGDLILLTHMLMNGSWHIYRPGERWKRRRDDMRITIGTAKMIAVAFTIQVAEFHTAASLARRRVFNQLGPSLLDEEFDVLGAAARLRLQGDAEVGTALLAQSVVAGIGNVYKSEACFACRVNPFRRVSSLSVAETAGLMAAARKFLQMNAAPGSGDRMVTYTGMRRTTRRADPAEALWVYARKGDPCRKCGALIESRKQGIDARTTFWCPVCQPAADEADEKSMAARGEPGGAR
ncbi:MAG: DNA-formamidopyrimidine glycosylase family protein [Candidatus Acidiferrales bacterium]